MGKLINFLTHVKECFDDGKKLRLSNEEALDCIHFALIQTNHFVYELSKTHELLRGMGTTMLCLYFHDESVIYAHIGDSRIYRLRDNGLEQLTKDHSLLGELIELGQISERLVRECSYKNVITRAVGTEPFVQPAVEIDSIRPDDLYLLCSDGLTDLLTNDEIFEVLNSPLTVEEKVRLLIVSAKKKGGHDNITCVCVEVKEVQVSEVNEQKSLLRQ